MCGFVSDCDDDDGDIAEGLKDNLEGLRFKKDRLILLEEEIEKKLAATMDDKSVEPDVIDDASPESAKSILDAVDVGKPNASHTELNGKSTGEVTDKSVLKNDPVASEASRGRMNRKLMTLNWIIRPYKRLRKEIR